MPTPTVPHRRPPSLTATLTGLGTAHATAWADPESEDLVVVSLGTVDVRVAIAGHRAHVLALLTDSITQVQAIGDHR